MCCLGANVANTKSAGRAGKTAIGDQSHLFAHALTRQRRRGRQHFAHARPTCGALVADHQNLALFIFALLHRFERVFLAFKHPCRSDKPLVLRGHARDFHNRAVRCDVALQANHTAGFRQWRCDGVNHLAIRLAGNDVYFLADAAARDGHAIAMHQTSFFQFLHDHRNATNLVKVFGHILPTRFQVDKIRRLAENVADISQIEINASLMRHRRQVQTSVGRATGTGHHTRRIDQRLAGDNIAGANVFLKQVHHRPTRSLAVLITALVRRRGARRIWQRKTDRLGHTGHGVGSELTTTSTGRWAGHSLQRFQISIRHVASLMLTNRLEHILNGNVAAFKTTGQNRAAVDEY